MISGWYTAASGMIAQMTNAANLANLSTPGYKQVNVHAEEFQNMLLSHLESTDDLTLGDVSTARRRHGAAGDQSRPGCAA